MGISDLYSLPYLGMKDGFHKYYFTAGNGFLSFFESAPIKEGEFEIELDVDKRGHISEFVFIISGKAKVICDRCLADILIPVKGNFIMHGKVSNETGDDAEIIYIRPDQSNIDLSQYIYEMICLSLPLTNLYDCSTENPRVCDDDVLSKLTKADEKEINKDVNVWDNLKGLSTDN